jgi:hypothetical protein
MPMIKKIIFTGIVCIILAIIIGLCIKRLNGNTSELLKVESMPIQSGSGWGYDILVDHKIFIHQEFIPAIPGKKPFANKEDALRTANVAIQKIVNGKTPYITRKEIDSLKISF